MREVQAVALRVEMPTGTPKVYLQELASERAIKIYIGSAEATAIAYALEHKEVPRPMSHDLMRNLLDALGARLVRVDVTEVRDRTYYAELHLVAAGGEIVVSARPSDAIALALRTGSPMFVADEVMDSAGFEIDNEDAEDDDNSDEIVGEFREFLDNIRPEDFSA